MTIEGNKTHLLTKFGKVRFLPQICLFVSESLQTDYFMFLIDQQDKNL